MFTFTPTERIEQALAFARIAHGDQTRHVTGEPYWHHPVEVANIVSSVEHDEDMLITALLHDTIEDTYVTEDDIALFFGKRIAANVAWLSDVSKPEDGNRAIRKALDRAHSSRAPTPVRTVKYADIIGNMNSIMSLDIEFAKVYVLEKRALLADIRHGDVSLYARAIDSVENAITELWER